MAKSFKKYREDSYDNEWDDDDRDIRQKDMRMQSRRDQRRQKTTEKFSAMDEDDS